MTAWKQTYTGGIFLLDAPGPEQVRLADVAHALSLICRFGGHCRRFYSVAEHSVRMVRGCKDVSPLVRMGVLLHDAAEAYTGDVVAPIKLRFAAGGAGGDFAQYEDQVDAAIHAALGHFVHTYSHAHSPATKDLDRRMLRAEAEHLMVWPPPWEWELRGVEPLLDERAWAADPGGWTPERAEEAFLAEYARLAIAVLPAGDARAADACALRDALARVNRVRAGMLVPEDDCDGRRCIHGRDCSRYVAPVLASCSKCGGEYEPARMSMDETVCAPCWNGVCRCEHGNIRVECPHHGEDAGGDPT